MTAQHIHTDTAQPVPAYLDMPWGKPLPPTDPATLQARMDREEAEARAEARAEAEAARKRAEIMDFAVRTHAGDAQRADNEFDEVQGLMSMDHLKAYAAAKGDPVATRAFKFLSSVVFRLDDSEVDAFASTQFPTLPPVEKIQHNLFRNREGFHCFWPKQLVRAAFFHASKMEESGWREEDEDPELFRARCRERKLFHASALKTISADYAARYAEIFGAEN